MRKTIIPNLVTMIFVICFGGCSVTTLKNPLNGPYLHAELSRGELKLESGVASGGMSPYKFFNPENVCGNLWFAYTLQVIECGGISIFTKSEVTRYNNDMRPMCDAVNLEVVRTGYSYMMQVSLCCAGKY